MNRDVKVVLGMLLIYLIVQGWLFWMAPKKMKGPDDE